MSTLFVFVFGLVFGSFVNVLIARIPTGETILGRSHCPKCGKHISWYDNIPLVSFVLLGGKCRECKKKISLVYPLVEALTGITFVVGLFTLHSLASLVFFFAATPLLLAMLVIDLKHMVIPDSLSFVFALMAFLFMLASESFYTNFLVGFGLALFLLTLFFITRKRGMGLGDVKLVLPMGWALGLPTSGYFLWTSFILGALVGGILLVSGAKTMKSQIPFGPFLIIAFIATLVVATG